MSHLLPLPAGPSPFPEVTTTPSYSLTTFASFSLAQFLRLPSSRQDLGITWSKDPLSATCSAFSYKENQSGQEAGIGRSSPIKTSEGSPFQRYWTNVLLAANVLVYGAQIATRGRLMQWGAKINSLIYRGQLWRLVTSSFLHVNAGHLLINCISLNSLGPSVETVSGPGRFFAIYFTSAVASTAMSYWLCKAPSVGASGAISGLIGSVAVFAMRHRGENGRAREDLLGIATVIVLNVVIGLVWKRIDNWGHLGGFLGGSAVAWFLGPA